MRKLASILSLAALASTLPAQQLLVPDSQNFANSGTTTAAWPTSAAGGRVQWCYDTTHWTNAGITAPVTINRLRFRAADGVRNLGGQVFTGVTVQLGYLNTAAPVLGDYNTMQTTYATNQGVMGPASAPLAITMAAVSGTVPNDYVVDIDLAANGAAFTYDPTTGVDLLIDFTFPAGGPVPATNLVAQGTSSVIGQRGRRCAGSLAGPGALSAFAAIILMDFGPADPGYTSRNGAHVESVGAPCGTTAQSFYQLFGTETFDLRGNPATSFLLVPDNNAAPNFYSVTKGTNAPDLSAKALGAGAPNTSDDGVVSETPGWQFNFPGGSTTTFSACTNGYVWLGSNTTGDFSPTLAEFLNSMARFCVMWNDQHAGRNTTTHPGSGMYVFTDNQGGPGTGRTTITWNQVGVFSNSIAGYVVNTFQLRLHENGNVEFRYGAMNGWGNASASLVGFSRGGTATVLAADPGSRDLSNEVPFSTQPEGAAGSLPLRLTVNSRPVLGLPAGINLIHTISNMPPATTVQAYILFDWAQQTPGVPLPLGPANCIVSLTAPVTWTTSGINPGATFTDAGVLLPTGPIPDAGLWMGAVFYIQGITMEFDGVTISTKSTNTLKHTMGLL
jgi:hypothetical protein